jgi:hypothetical protein
MRGGKREGAGRKPGSKTQKTAEIALKAAEQGVTPLEYLLEVMRKPIPDDMSDELKARMIGSRMDAAKAAAPYVHPRLQAIEHSGKDGGDIPISLKIEYVDPATKKA